ncbi:UvrD-helicase domain-containing protein [Lacinutrix iliipiscaria]|uniref:DNA 3'-5' helicase n=1 Tax=Lacinutrix iliipiscaria TaxID=1230532 RepID=A0ABW5WJE2_9FLAO
MQSQYPFTIYNASAGSGKTFTLVKEYLKILFQSNNQEQFKHILAITFTNKAVGEMKERIIETLTQFSSEEILKKPNSMFEAITEELQIESKALHHKSKKILNSIIYNYAAFDVSTIDGFTHKIIRTFAHDLKLPLNFEVELDQDSLLQEAVDSLIAKAGTNTELTKVLVDFAIEKVDDDKSWDIAYDFNKIAKLLVSENDLEPIEKLKDKSLEDFKTLKAQLKKDIQNIEVQIVETAQNVLTLIEECGLQFNDFTSSYLPKYFQKLTTRNFSANFDLNWQIALLNSESLYPKRVTSEIASTIDAIQSELMAAFNTTKDLIFKSRFLISFYKNVTPLSVLNAIYKELNGIKQEQNKMLISEFNTIISNEIKGQPTPFIYERLGEKFQHYFIDEFQDTSKLQWENLIPLIDHSLSSENLKQVQGSALLVGDAKQAIYRWRGGEAEQFIDLYSKKVFPFPNVPQHVDNLPANYRSFQEIICFNNSFFHYLSQTFFSHTDYADLYKDGSNQETSIEKEGYIQLDFLDLKDEDRDEIFPHKVLETITNCKANGFNYQDICVLVRRGKDGIAIAEYLNAASIPIMSSETMLVFNSPEVQFIDQLLNLLVQPENEEIKINALRYLAQKFEVNDQHQFFSHHLKQSLFQTFKSLETYHIYLTPNQLLQLPLYEIAETIVRHFNLVKTSNAYVQFYLDFVLEYTQKQGSSLSGFLEHSAHKKQSLSIISPQGQNAVQIMTIHKSKGLEFPVVIFPYADLKVYNEIDPKEWFELEAEHYNGFSHTLLNYNKENFKNYGEQGLSLYNKHEAALELDNINLLYVTLTRPIEQLYIISKKNVSDKELKNPKTFAGLFINYLKEKQKWSDHKTTYTYGNSTKMSEEKPTTTERIEQKEFISTSKESHNIKIVTNSGYLWNTEQEKAIEKGNLIHDIMAHINTKDDITFAITHFLDHSIINPHQAVVLQKTVRQIVEHNELNQYFTSENTIYNERDIISKSKVIIRPDRLVVNSKKEAVIIDYKTGHEAKSHQLQLDNYQNIIEEMPYKVIKKILVYINDDIKIVQF